MDLIEELLGLVDALQAERVEYALCGGIALAIHGHPRFTKDIDLLVQSGDRERVRAVGRQCGFTLEGGSMHFGSGTPRERELARLTKVEGAELLTLDLLFSGPALANVWASRLAVQWRGRKLWVVSREGLVAMKRLSARAQDLADIERLLGEPEGDRR